MKNLSIGILLTISFASFGQNSCDSTLFNQLFKISKQDKVNSSDFQRSKNLVDSLSYRFCDHVIILPDSIYTSLTYTYGRICLKANSTESVNSFLKYRLDHKGSAEEMLSFTLENLFVKKPDIILQEISRYDSITKEDILNDLIWGFLNNRTYGATDPFEFNPFKAMTYYENPPKTVLNFKNYKDLYFKVNPRTIDLYPKYKRFYDYILKGIYLELLDQEERIKNNNR